MDFDDTREEAEFRKEVRQWLGANAEPKSGAFETWQSRYPGRDGYEGLERAKEFQAKKADAGFAALHWPVEWGGRALPPIYQVIYSQEETRYLVARGYFEIDDSVHQMLLAMREGKNVAPVLSNRKAAGQ